MLQAAPRELHFCEQRLFTERLEFSWIWGRGCSGQQLKQNEEGNVVLVMEQGGWAQPCHPPRAAPDLFPKRGDPPGAAMGGEVTMHPGRDLVASTSCSCHE